jgi:hypothetical protein
MSLWSGQVETEERLLGSQPFAPRARDDGRAGCAGVEICPAWRGYKILPGDQIIIVEPNTLRIVMIIDA